MVKQYGEDSLLQGDDVRAVRSEQCAVYGAEPFSRKMNRGKIKNHGKLLKVFHDFLFC